MQDNSTISFMDKYIPDTMAPLDCMDSMLELAVGFGTLEEMLRKRWAPLMRENEMMKVSAKFWPSDALIEKLLACDSPFAVTTDDGLLLANRGQETTPVIYPCDEDSLIIRYPWDLLKLNEMIVGSLADDEIAGEISPRAEIRGKIRLGQGSVILPGVFIEGNAVIGENCKIGPNCYIRGNTSVGDNCHIGQAVEIKNSIIGNKVAIGHLSYAGDSVIMHRVNFGAGTIISNFRHDGKNHKFKVGNEL